MAMGDMFRWEVWCSKGWTEADLCLVVAFINRRIKAQRRWPESLRLHNLIDPARFADDLQDAKGEARIPPVTFKDRVMEGRPKQERRENVRTPAQVLAAAEAFRKFREYAKTL